MLNKSILQPVALAALAFSFVGAADSKGAKAQDRTLTISRATSIRAAPFTFTDSAGIWDRVPSSALYTSGPQFAQTTAFRAGRGSLVPIDVDTAVLRNVSIRGLRRGGYYNFFGLADSRTVIINPSTRRIARVLNNGDYSHASSEVVLADSASVGRSRPAYAYADDYGYGYGSGFGYDLGFGSDYYGGGYYGGGRLGYRPDLGRPDRPGPGFRPGLRPTPYGGGGVARAGLGGGRGGIGGGGRGGGGRRG